MTEVSYLNNISLIIEEMIAPEDGQPIPMYGNIKNSENLQPGSMIYDESRDILFVKCGMCDWRGNQYIGIKKIRFSDRLNIIENDKFYQKCLKYNNTLLCSLHTNQYNQTLQI